MEWKLNLVQFSELYLYQRVHRNCHDGWILQIGIMIGELVTAGSTRKSSKCVIIAIIIISVIIIIIKSK